MTRIEEIMAAVTANGMREWTDERVKQAMQEYAKECAQASLEKAADNGALELYKESICNPENIILP